MSDPSHENPPPPTFVTGLNPHPLPLPRSASGGVQKDGLVEIGDEAGVGG